MDTPSTSSQIAAAPNHRVRNLLRTIIILAFAGLFVAGALSVGKLFKYELPCGPSHGCDIVNSHPSSRWFGIPVAYFGFGGYLLILGLALARSGMTAVKARPVALAGYVVSGFGALASVILQIYSFTEIKATCLWCLTSAALMLLLLFFHALEYSDRTSDDVPEGKGDFALAGALALVVLVSLAGFTMNLKKAAVVSEPVHEIAEYPLVPKDAHMYGDAASPVTIVEFADLMCPHCQQDSPQVKQFVGSHPGRLRIVYRNFPLQMHPMSTLSAAVGEAAADVSTEMYWKYIDAIMATGKNMQTPDEVWDVAKSVGLDPDKVKADLKNESGPAMKRLTNDVNTANALGISTTPTFIVQVKGMETKAYSFSALMEALQKGDYKRLVEGS